jgi:hypothetical protein
VINPRDLIFGRYNPLRPLAVAASRRLRLGSFADRVRIGAFERPNYAYCVFHAADLARKLGYTKISVAEFGVAGGNGLVLLERYADAVAEEIGIQIEVYGFDTGTGLPDPVDYRDLPYHWQPGFFRMDEERLRRRLRNARLVIGDLRETAETFFDTHQPAPLAAVMHDLDFYSSTQVALTMFEANEQYRLPRVFCYFDDVVGEETELYNDFTGERLAIAEFNERNKTKKLSPAYHLITRADREQWYHQIYVLHDFEHRHYNRFVSETNQQLPLD